MCGNDKLSVSLQEKIERKMWRNRVQRVADERAELTGKRKQANNLVLRSVIFREKATAISRSAVNNLLSVN